LVSSLSLVPWQCGQAALSCMSSSTPEKDTISESSPSPTRKSSSEPKTCPQQLLQRHPIHPFHLDAVPDSGHVGEGIDLADVHVAQAVADFEFLPEQAFIDRVPPVLRLQALIDPEPAIAVGLVEVAVTT